MKHNKKGVIAVSVIVVLFISFVGMSLLTFSVLHTRIVRARTYQLSTIDRMYQDLIYYLHDFREKIFARDMREFSHPGLEYFNSNFFPGEVIGQSQTNYILPSFSSVDIPKPTYNKSRVTTLIDVSCPGTGYRLNAELTIEVLAGDIPVTMFPFFSNHALSRPLAEFLEKNRLVTPGDYRLVSEEVETSFSISDFLLEAMKINGTVLSWRQIRERCGLVLSDEAIPEGIYIITADNHTVIQSIYVQGDIERLVFAARGGIQVIRFIKDTISYEIQYQPGGNNFSCWDANIPHDRPFSEILIVNGNVWALEKAVDSEVAFTSKTRISLSISGKAVICSDLDVESKQLDLKEIQLSNLTLTCGKDQLFDKGEAAEVVVEKQEKTSLSVSIIAEGKVTNKSNELKVSGSIYCRELENTGGNIQVRYCRPGVDPGGFFVIVDFKCVYRFIIQYIEEVADEGR